MRRALVLDFDGLILDTETAAFESWSTAYDEHGLELSRTRWQRGIGTDRAGFAPLEEIGRRMGPGGDVEAMNTRRRLHRDALIARMEPMPGVTAWLRESRRAGLRVGVASSSPLEWVEGHLERLGLREYFDAFATEEDVDRVKPSPDLYLTALERLGAAPDRALALEDSPNGVAAAKAAGITCVAVPGPMTRGLAFDAADLVLDSLAERRLADVWRALLEG